MQNSHHLCLKVGVYNTLLSALVAHASISADWLRVILDEAHSCKSRSSKTAKAVYALRAQCRWAVTGKSHSSLDDAPY